MLKDPVKNKSEEFKKLSQLEISMLSVYGLNRYLKNHSQYKNSKPNKQSIDRNLIGLHVLQEWIKELLDTNEYTLDGIAFELREPVDVIIDLVTGINQNPSMNIAIKLFELHSNVKRAFYFDLKKRFFYSLRNSKL